MAWRLSFQAAGAPNRSCTAAAAPTEGLSSVSLQPQWLATRPPPRTGLRPRSGRPGSVAPATEHRYMALALLPEAHGCLHMVAASSSATLQLLCLELSTQRWATFSYQPRLSLPALAGSGAPALLHSRRGGAHQSERHEP